MTQGLRERKAGSQVTQQCFEEHYLLVFRTLKGKPTTNKQKRDPNPKQPPSVKTSHAAGIYAKSSINNALKFSLPLPHLTKLTARINSSLCVHPMCRIVANKVGGIFFRDSRGTNLEPGCQAAAEGTCYHCRAVSFTPGLGSP